MSVKLRIRTLKSGDKNLLLDIYHNKSRHYEFLTFKILKNDTKEDKKEKRQLAENIRAKREIEVSSGTYDFIPNSKKKVDFIQYFQKFVDDYNGTGVKKFKYSLKKFKTYLKKDKIQFQHLNKKVCQGYCDFLRSKESGLSGETPFDYFKRFQTVLNKAVEDEIIKKNPSQGIKITRESNQLKKEVLTKEELQKLANAYCGNENVKRAFLLACFTGLGEAEIRKLTWNRVQNDKLKLFREKNGKQAIIPLHQVALHLLGERKELKDKIFTLPSEAAIRKNLKNWLKKAEIEKHISFYCGRHTFATQLLINGANLKTVADCLGHSTTQHTIKYLNYVNELKDEAINNLPNIEF